MSNGRGKVTLVTEGDDVIASHPALLTDRSARMLFGSILGGKPTESGWRCPRRRLPISSLIVRINTFLERNGWHVDRQGIADRAIQDEIERKRSFDRAKAAAVKLIGGEPSISQESVQAAL